MDWFSLALFYLARTCLTPFGVFRFISLWLSWWCPFSQQQIVWSLLLCTLPGGKCCPLSVKVQDVGKEKLHEALGRQNPFVWTLRFRFLSAELLQHIAWEHVSVVVSGVEGYTLGNREERGQERFQFCLFLSLSFYLSCKHVRAQTHTHYPFVQERAWSAEVEMKCEGDLCCRAKNEGILKLLCRQENIFEHCHKTQRVHDTPPIHGCLHI